MAKNAKEASDFLSEALLQLDNVLSGTSLFSPSYKTQDCIGYTCTSYTKSIPGSGRNKLFFTKL